MYFGPALMATGILLETSAIGTDAPAEKLHVNGKIRANDYDLEALPALT